MAVQLVDCLVQALANAGVGYCNWKSNFHLSEDLEQGGELDLLVSRNDTLRFERILSDLGFKQAYDPIQVSGVPIFHYYGLDQPSGKLIHLHVYYRVVTGESLLKDYCFPIEELLLRNTRMVQGVPVPQPSAELIVFVLRAMIKHASPLDYAHLRGGSRSGYADMRAELVALLAGGDAARCSELLARWLPGVDSALFYQCIEALRGDAPMPRRLLLATRLRRQLRAYRRFSPVTAMAQRAALVLKRTRWRVSHGGKSKRLASGGAVVAFVGPEATGKSTLVHETASWLGKIFDVSTAHLGKPPATVLTYLPNLMLPLLRRAAPQHRMSRVEQQAGASGSERVSLLYGVRSVLVAWDRHALAARIRRRAVDGGIVICDRYPSACVGAMDSARLAVPAKGDRRRRVLRYLATLENHLYRKIPPPDTVIRLTVPVEVAIARNQERQKKGKENDAYVLRRHTVDAVPTFPASRTIELDSNQSRAQTIAAARQMVWESL